MYDFLGYVTQKTDSFENVTQYVHDGTVNKVSQVDLPPILSLEEEALPVTTFSSYDSLGRKVSEADANGNTTKYCYNAYGSITEIQYPDGSKESFRYKTDGTLKSHTDQDGFTIYYTHDVLGRILSKSYEDFF